MGREKYFGENILCSFKISTTKCVAPGLIRWLLIPWWVNRFVCRCFCFWIILAIIWAEISVSILKPTDTKIWSYKKTVPEEQQEIFWTKTMKPDFQWICACWLLLSLRHQRIQEGRRRSEKENFAWGIDSLVSVW